MRYLELLVLENRLLDNHWEFVWCIRHWARTRTGTFETRELHKKLSFAKSHEKLDWSFRHEREWSQKGYILGTWVLKTDTAVKIEKQRSNSSCSMQVKRREYRLVQHSDQRIRRMLTNGTYTWRELAWNGQLGEPPGTKIIRWSYSDHDLECF